MVPPALLRFGRCLGTYPRYTLPVDSVHGSGRGNLSQVSTLRVTSALVSGQATKKGSADFRAYQDCKMGIHRALLNRVDLERVATRPDDDARRQVYTVIQELASNSSSNPKSALGAPEFTASEKERLSLEVLNEVFRLGPLEPLLQDPTISDILVNGANEVYIERGGVLEEFGGIFKDDAHLMRIIEKIVAAVGRRVDESSPMVDARLADGSRINVIIPPLSLKGPTLTIRKFPERALLMQDLIGMGSVSMD